LSSARLEWERNEELRKKQEKEDRIRRGFERRMNPKVDPTIRQTTNS
jgi:hypothetical protein